MSHQLISNWREKITFSKQGPQPFVVTETEKLKVVLIGLEPGQKLPPHPAPEAVYTFLDGSGWMIVDDARVRVQAGTMVVAPANAKRGVEAETRLAFIGARVP